LSGAYLGPIACGGVSYLPEIAPLLPELFLRALLSLPTENLHSPDFAHSVAEYF
jgi:hypothetical protein